MKDVVDGSLDLTLGANLPRGVRRLLRPLEPPKLRGSMEQNWTKVVVTSLRTTSIG